MITWRGWGWLVLFIGALPFIFTVPMALTPVPAGETPPLITGYFVWPLLVSAALTYGLNRLLTRRSDRRHDFMSITVAAWAYVFLAGAVAVAAIWALEKAGVM